ncbi:MAG: glutamate racemase [Oscillospiraceae bacterium]|nr:glutamate racemase [Oscillospiraceae bacterium]
MKENNLPIGVFDSGLGGLTVVCELSKILPNEDIIYFGDTGRVPYGSRSKKIINKYSNQDISFLKSVGVKAVVAACGTVSSVAINSLREPKVLTGVVEPAVITASKLTKNFKIGVIGTSATIGSKTYSKYLKNANSNFVIFEKSCPLFVPLVENGLTSSKDPIVLEITRRYLIDFKNQGIDTLILGCTHYPILKNAISKIVGKDINLVDSGRETAIFVAKYLKNSKMLSNNNNGGKYSFFVSDEIESFKVEADKFLKWNAPYSLEKIDIELY